MSEYKLGKLAGLDISATPMAILGTLILWLVLSLIALLILKLPLVTAILGGLAGAILHQVADLWHQLGHAWAARRTGHPMTGIRFGYLGVLSTSLYPANEGELPAGVHINRAVDAANVEITADTFCAHADLAREFEHDAIQ